MTAPQSSVILHHGTTLHRAERLQQTPPDPDFSRAGWKSIRPGRRVLGQSSPVKPDVGLGSAEHYARMKAANFPEEGGPVILEVEVLMWIVDILRNDPIANMVVESVEVRFEPSLGLEKLRQAWPNLVKKIVKL